MTEFHQSLQQTSPPSGMPPLAEALWWLAKNEWERAHAIAQDVDTPDGAWVHAHLHRAEGDPANAAYWYRQAAKPVCRDSLAEEREDICSQLLSPI